MLPERPQVFPRSFETERLRFERLCRETIDPREYYELLSDRSPTVEDELRFLPYQPWEDLPYSLTSADVSVVAVKEGFEGIVVSSKLYTAMAARQPVLVIAQGDDDEARIVEGEHVTDPAAFGRRLNALLKRAYG